MKLHIGCGKKYLQGYKHLDVIDHAHVDFACDARDLHMIEDACVSEIYACHVLEHVWRHEVPNVLKEWNRVLGTGALIRIAVPDFAAIAEQYMASGNLAASLGLLYGGQTYDYNSHHVAFDFEVLKGYLEATGFRDIERYDWRDFLPADYDDYSRAYLPHMDFENGRLMSLNVIAFKA